MRKSTLLVCLLSPSVMLAQNTINTTFLQELLEKHRQQFDTVLNAADNKQVQILYTQIDRDKNNMPVFTSYGYHIDAAHYFYPASTVKLPAVIFALEKMRRLGIPLNARMTTEADYPKQTRVENDSTSATGYPTVENYVKKILLTSDNDAFNRLYEFIGREELNQRLRECGATHSRIINRLAIGDGGEFARHTNPIVFEYNMRKIHLAGQYDKNDYPLELNNLLRGTAYMDADDKQVNQPYSFAYKNVFPLEDQQLILRKLLFPETFPFKERFFLGDDDYRLVYKYMSMYPTESDAPKYDPDEFFPLYAKMFFYGHDKNAQPLPDVRIFNKYGDSYGYVIDNAYFVDFKNKVEFLVAVVVQSNNDGIYNDDKYEYDTVCYPFLKNLGKVLYEYELQRRKKRLPDLQKFNLR